MCNRSDSASYMPRQGDMRGQAEGVPRSVYAQAKATTTVSTNSSTVPQAHERSW